MKNLNKTKKGDEAAMRDASDRRPERCRGQVRETV